MCPGLEDNTRKDKFTTFHGMFLEDDGGVACPDEARTPFLTKAADAMLGPWRTSSQTTVPA